MRAPGHMWMVRGPCEFIPDVEIEIVDRRKALPLDENEGIYVRDIKTGKVILFQNTHFKHRLQTYNFIIVKVQLPYYQKKVNLLKLYNSSQTCSIEHTIIRAEPGKAAINNYEIKIIPTSFKHRIHYAFIQINPKNKSVKYYMHSLTNYRLNITY